MKVEGEMKAKERSSFKLKYLVALMVSMQIMANTTSCDSPKRTQELERELKELRASRASEEAAQSILLSQAKGQLQVCEEALQEASGPVNFETVDLVKGDKEQLLPCDSNIKVGLTKIEQERVYLSYLVNGVQKYSDPLYFQGKFSDRSSLYINGEKGYSVLLKVEGCEGNRCEVACLNIKTSQPQPQPKKQD